MDLEKLLRGVDLIGGQMSDRYKNCPRCGKQVKAYLYGGRDKFGCDEYDAEIECQCGISFSLMINDVEHWEDELANVWNTRVSECD